ncbi:MAG: ATP cone domain-containing protein [Dehalococcoidia bacterium]|nr:ATP cone domain-containing protein [Dehalococcoidia bacterium]
MSCPFCNNKSKIIAIEKKETTTYRMHKCISCNKKFNSVEKLLLRNTMVIKRDNRREKFEEKKLLNSLSIATSKRPIPTNSLNAILEDITQTINDSDINEVSTKIISKMVISHLSRLDLISYVRYASTYQDFISIDQMSHELQELSSNPANNHQQQKLFNEQYI